MSGPNSNYTAVLHMNVWPGGFTERYHLRDMDLTSAMACAGHIAYLRAGFFREESCEIPLVLLKDEKIDRWSIAAFDRPLVGSYVGGEDAAEGVNPAGGIINNVQDAVSVRMEAANGKKSPRFIQAAMDYAIVNHQLQKAGEVEYDTLNAGGPTPTVTLLTAPVQLLGFWEGVKKLRDFLVAKCCMIKKEDAGLNPDGVQTWTIKSAHNFTQMVLRGASTRKVGRPFDSPHGRRSA